MLLNISIAKIKQAKNDTRIQLLTNMLFKSIICKTNYNMLGYEAQINFYLITIIFVRLTQPTT
ncbi:hypothetical protein Riv7116_5474 [Rivularia sp. PCC 7116]|nr:hypothetical protein Riv7116_5474 [Rivularia sp. PCC 7116]